MLTGESAQQGGANTPRKLRLSERHPEPVNNDEMRAEKPVKISLFLAHNGPLSDVTEVSF